MFYLQSVDFLLKMKDPAVVQPSALNASCYAVCVSDRRAFWFTCIENSVLDWLVLTGDLFGLNQTISCIIVVKNRKIVASGFFQRCLEV